MDDKNKTPEQILDEIMNRASPPPVYYPPKPEPDAPDPPGNAPPPSAPPGTAAQTDAPAKPHPWLWGALGAALLALAVCASLLVNASRKLNAQESALEENTQLADSLQEKIETLRQEKKKLEEELSVSEEIQNATAVQHGLLNVQIYQNLYLWFIEQFMDDGDYPMAAAALVITQHSFFDLPDGYISNGVSYTYPRLNSAQQQHLDEFVDELVDRGYLKHFYKHLYDSSPNGVNYARQWEQEHIEDINVLSLLWAMLNQYYVSDYPYSPAQWIAEYHSFTSDEVSWDSLSDRVSETAGDYALQLYRRMVQELTADGYLAQTEDGYETVNSDILDYSLPFDFPISIAP